MKKLIMMGILVLTTAATQASQIINGVEYWTLDEGGIVTDFFPQIPSAYQGLNQNQTHFQSPLWTWAMGQSPAVTGVAWHFPVPFFVPQSEISANSGRTPDDWAVLLLDFYDTGNTPWPLLSSVPTPKPLGLLVLGVAILAAWRVPR